MGPRTICMIVSFIFLVSGLIIIVVKLEVFRKKKEIHPPPSLKKMLEKYNITEGEADKIINLRNEMRNVLKRNQISDKTANKIVSDFFGI